MLQIAPRSPDAAPPAPPAPPIAVAALADELLAGPAIPAHFAEAYRGTPAALVVVGAGWEQDALEAAVAQALAPFALPDTDHDVIAIAAPAGAGVEHEVAAIARVLLSAEPAPAPFRFLVRVEPTMGTGPAPIPRNWGEPEDDLPRLPLHEELPGLLRSRMCTSDQFDDPEYDRWCARFKTVKRLHRKQWEHVYISRALEERGMLAPGRRGIGFGVGSEPLTAAYAACGAEILATDLDVESATEAGWQNGSQHAASLDALNIREICDPEEFRRLVSFRVQDMNAISPDLHGQFDFTWSSCCFEHLGSIEHGLRFVQESLELLKPGGIAVHTTELNLSSNEDTVATGGVVLFRRRDIDRLAQRLTRAGHRICLDYTEGTGPADRHVDVPPYKGNPHLRLKLLGYVSTSIGLIVQKGAA